MINHTHSIEMKHAKQKAHEMAQEMLDSKLKACRVAYE